MPVTKTETEERVNIRIPKPMVDEIDRIVQQYPAYNWNRQQLVETAIREKITQMRTIQRLRSRFEHYNVYEDHATVIDNALGGKWIDIYFRDDKPFCEHCEEADCEHIRFLLEIPEVVKDLKEHGWTITETGKIVRR